MVAMKQVVSTCRSLEAPRLYNTCRPKSTSFRAHGKAPFGLVPQRAPSVPARTAIIVHAASQELEEIDPVTGEVISKAVTASVAPDTLVTASGLSWSYRTVDPGTPDTSLPEVLLLHGLGSSSYSYRNTIQLFANAGIRAYAPDWIGHGSSEKPDPGRFDYSESAYMKALGEFIEAAPIKKPLVLALHGFVLSQYALLWALKNEDKICKLIILNTPLSSKSALRPELAAYKNPIPFLRPKGKFDAMNFNAAGSPYAMEYRDASAYAAPYENEETASMALQQTMDKVEFADLCQRVDGGYTVWRKPSLLVWGGADPFLRINNAFDFLESKRTCMRLAEFEAKLGHMPQEDYAEAISGVMVEFIKEKEE